MLGNIVSGRAEGDDAQAPGFGGAGRTARGNRSPSVPDSVRAFLQGPQGETCRMRDDGDHARVRRIDQSRRGRPCAAGPGLGLPAGTGHRLRSRPTPGQVSLGRGAVHASLRGPAHRCGRRGGPSVPAAGSAAGPPRSSRRPRTGRPGGTSSDRAPPPQAWAPRSGAERLRAGNGAARAAQASSRATLTREPSRRAACSPVRSGPRADGAVRGWKAAVGGSGWARSRAAVPRARSRSDSGTGVVRTGKPAAPVGGAAGRQRCAGGGGHMPMFT